MRPGSVPDDGGGPICALGAVICVPGAQDCVFAVVPVIEFGRVAKGLEHRHQVEGAEVAFESGDAMGTLLLPGGGPQCPFAAGAAKPKVSLEPLPGNHREFRRRSSTGRRIPEHGPRESGSMFVWSEW